MMFKCSSISFTRVTGIQSRRDTPGLPSVADKLPVTKLPSVRAAEWGQDDERASEGTSLQHRTIVFE